VLLGKYGCNVAVSMMSALFESSKDTTQISRKEIDDIKIWASFPDMVFEALELWNNMSSLG